MHEYYRKKSGKLRKEMEGFLKTISAELEKDTERSFSDLNAEIWDLYEKEMLERFPYIGGDSAGGTKNLTGAFMLVAMGRSSRAPSLGTSAGARFTETRPFRPRPRARRAARTRSCFQVYQFNVPCNHINLYIFTNSLGLIIKPFDRVGILQRCHLLLP